MGRYQQYKGNAENKLFYLIDNLIGGINTDFSDDTSNDNEFNSIINFNVDKKGSLVKRLGFGKLDALGQIFNKFSSLPEVRCKTEEYTNPEETNDNVVYMKLLRNDNKCFRNLSAFTGEKAYRQYQRLYGSQNNSFELLIITTNYTENKSKSWYYKCTLPSLEYENGEETNTETIVTVTNISELPVLFKWDRNLCNIDTIEYFDKIYFTDNDKGLACYDRTNHSFTFYGEDISGQASNLAYKPSPMEIRKVGFNVLGHDPLHWIDYKGISTDSIQGVYLTTLDNIPLMNIPSGNKFYLNILYTGSDSTFDIEFKEGSTSRDATVIKNTNLSSNGLAVYEVTFKAQPTSNTEIKITKTGANISPYYDFYDVASVNPEEKPVTNLNIGDYKMVECYNRAVYYKDDTMWFSELNNFDYVPNYNYVSLPIEPTDEITKIVFFRNVYIIFTKQRIYKMLNSFGDNDFSIMPLNMGIGCNAPNTVVPIDNVLYFASPRGLYELISSAVYGANSNVTFENVRELDTKVKSLTSDVTMYVSEVSDPSIKYNGISDVAYALRYKDKYMLFFNTSYEKGDIAAQKNLDALVYDYSIKAFSEIRFPIKPTFLFRVDSAIETFATVKQKEEYSDEETLIDYDFETTPISDGTIADSSENSLDASVGGRLTSSPGIGLDLDGDGYVKIGSVPDEVRSGIEVEIDCDIKELSNGSIINMKQATPVAASTNESVTIESDEVNGYKASIVCDIVPNAATNEAVVNWTFYWKRTNANLNGACNGSFKLVDKTSNITLLEASAFNLNIPSGSTEYVAGGSGNFVISYDASRNYSKEWELTASSTYPVTVTNTGWNNGGAVGISHELTAGYNWLKMGFSGSAYISANGQCTVSITPYIKNSQDLYVGSRACNVILDGVSYGSTIPSISSRGTHTGTAINATFYYNGEKTISISGNYNIRATISGSYKETVSTGSVNQGLPKTQSYSYSTTTWYPMNIAKAKQVTLSRLSNLSYRDLRLSIDENDEHKLSVHIENEDYIFDGSIVNNSKSVIGRHTWVLSLTKVDDDYKLEVSRKDVDDVFGSAIIDKKYVYNGIRNNNTILEGIESSLYKFKIISTNSTYMLYNIDEGSGNTLNDSASTPRNGTIYGTYTWEVESGLKFNGNGYLILPELGVNVPFTNGFTVEFECRVEDINDVCKVFDFATGYDTGASGNDKSSINCSISKELISLMTTSSSKKSYKLNYSAEDILNRHKWKFSIVDNGKSYDTYIYVDEELVSTSNFRYGGISNIRRRSNYIGKSNIVGEKLFKGMLYNFKVTINKSPNPTAIYEGAMYEYDTTFDDFGEPMDIELETKGINLKYPMHQKKIKNLFVKGVGGYSYSEFFLEVYADGHLVNDPRRYRAYVDEVTGQVIYDYTEIKDLSFDEQEALLGNLRLDNTRLGKTEYETKKIIIPSTKCKNVIVKIYGKSDDYLSIESLGFLFKLGKVKGEK